MISHDSDSVRSNLQKLHYLVVPDRKAGGILEEKGVMTLLANGIMVRDVKDFSWELVMLNYGNLIYLNNHEISSFEIL